MMKAFAECRLCRIELTGTVDERGNLSLDEPLSIDANSRVRVIILCPDEATTTDPDDTPDEDVKASLRVALAEAKSGQRIPLEQLWQ